MHKITFSNDINHRFMTNILKYSVKFTNNNNLLSDGFHHKKDENEYELLLKLNYGKNTIIYEDVEICLNYEKTHSTPIATAEEIKYYETLELVCKDKDKLLKYIEEVRSDSATTDKNNKLLCRILKPGGGWGLLHRINKRSDDTLFMDIDIKGLFSEIQSFFDDVKTKYLTYVTALIPLIYIVSRIVDLGGDFFQAASIGIYLTLLASVTMLLGAFGIVKLPE